MAQDQGTIQNALGKAKLDQSLWVLHPSGHQMPVLDGKEHKSTMQHIQHWRDILNVQFMCLGSSLGTQDPTTRGRKKSPCPCRINRGRSCVPLIVWRSKPHPRISDPQTSRRKESIPESQVISRFQSSTHLPTAQGTHRPQTPAPWYPASRPPSTICPGFAPLLRLLPVLLPRRTTRT